MASNRCGAERAAMAIGKTGGNRGQRAAKIIAEGVFGGNGDALGGDGGDQHAHGQRLAIDQHAVAIEDDEIERGGHDGDLLRIVIGVSIENQVIPPICCFARRRFPEVRPIRLCERQTCSGQARGRRLSGCNCLRRPVRSQLVREVALQRRLGADGPERGQGVAEGGDEGRVARQLADRCRSSPARPWDRPWPAWPGRVRRSQLGSLGSITAPLSVVP